MRVLLDECINVRFRHELVGHEVRTVDFMGWKSLKDGNLLSAASELFDVIITLDGNLPAQQALDRFDIAVFVLRTESSALAHLKILLPHLHAALQSPVKGRVTWVNL